MRAAVLLLAVSAAACDGTAAGDAGVDAGVDAGAPSLPDQIGPPDRPATLVTPSAHDGVTPLPVLVLLHGRTTSGLAQDTYFQMSRETRRRGFYLIIPDGTVDENDESFWNATPACCDFFGSGVDDSAYLIGLVDTLAELAPIADVYFTGHSNGGFMSFRMACDHSDRVTAIASFNGSDFLNDDDCVPSQPVSIAVIQGDLDESVPIDGDPGRHPGAREVAARWARRAGCADTTSTGPNRDLDRSVDGEETTVEIYDDCTDAEVELWISEGGVHAPALSRSFSAQLLDWLETQRRPRP